NLTEIRALLIGLPGCLWVQRNSHQRRNGDGRRGRERSPAPPAGASYIGWTIQGFERSQRLQRGNICLRMRKRVVGRGMAGIGGSPLLEAAFIKMRKVTACQPGGGRNVDVVLLTTDETHHASLPSSASRSACSQ